VGCGPTVIAACNAAHRGFGGVRTRAGACTEHAAAEKREARQSLTQSKTPASRQVL